MSQFEVADEIFQPVHVRCALRCPLLIYICEYTIRLDTQTRKKFENKIYKQLTQPSLASDVHGAL